MPTGGSAGKGTSMASNAHTFSGAHGTPDALRIQTRGFKIADQTTGASMFGGGVYFYRDDAFGRKFAKKWGELRALQTGMPPGLARVICVSFRYGENRFFRWGIEEEKEIFKLLKQWVDAVPGRRFSRKIQNELRERYLTQLISQMPEGCALVLADLPLPPEAVEKEIKRYPGCIVRDVSILPSPPYIVEE